MRHLLLATLRRVHGDQGQMAVFGVLFLAMFAASGLAIVDVGSWYAARRDAQADADFIALAGALELPSFDDDAGAVVRAQTAAADWALANDVDPLDPDVALTVQVVDDCYSANDEVHTGVRVTVQRVPKSYFIAFFPGVSPSVSAVAQACSGTPQEMTGFVPWALPLAGDCFEDDPLTPGVRVPIYGARCDIIVSAGTPSVGQLGFKDPGGCADGDSGGSYKGNIVTGVDRRCSVGDSVSSNPGINVGQTQKGIEDRLLTEGACATLAIPISGKVDSDTMKFNLHPTLEDLLNPGAGGIDDFFEVWGPGLGYDVAQPAE